MRCFSVFFSGEDHLSFFEAKSNIMNIGKQNINFTDHAENLKFLYFFGKIIFHFLSKIEGHIVHEIRAKS